jgi:sporulation protein YtfJ
MDIANVVKVVMEEIKEIVHSETVVGKPVQAEDSVIIPVSRVTFGFGAGAGGENDEGKGGNGIGTGAGATIDPVAFVVVSKGKAQLLPLKSREATLTRIIDLVPDIIEFLQKSKETKSRDEADDTASTEESTEA